MKSTVTLLLVGLLFVSGLAFAQGMRVEVKDPKKVEDPEKLEKQKRLEELQRAVEKKVAADRKMAEGRIRSEEKIEIELELEEPDAEKKVVRRRVIVLGGEGGEGGRIVELNGKTLVLEGEDGGDARDLAGIIEELKAVREKIRASGREEGCEGGKHVVVRRMGGAHPMPKPPVTCPHCGPQQAPRKVPSQPRRQVQPGPMGPMMPMMLNGLRQSIDALRGEIAGLRTEIRSIRGAHAPKAPAGAYHFYGAKGGSAGVAVRPAPKPVAVRKSAAGGVFVARSPAKPDPRQAKLEKEVQDLRKETAHLKAMMAELLRKMDAMQKAKETK